MTSCLRPSWCFFLLFAGLPLLAAAQSGAPTASPGGGQTATKPTARPHLAARPPVLADLQNLLTLMRQPTTTPPQVVEAVQVYCTKYPTSLYRATADMYGMQFAQARHDYPDMLAFGHAALKINPKMLVPLLVLGSAIPDQVKPTDLNGDQQLRLAAEYNRRALAIAQDFPTVYNGHQLSPQRVALIQREIRASAYSALGVIAMNRGRYPDALSELNQAVNNDNARSKAVDYYRIGVAQAALKQYSAALQTLRRALALGPDNPTLQ
ncbi:MAG: BTAD domain-containing putative transcriptional regulator, partial [Terriglobales bacterium]